MRYVHGLNMNLIHATEMITASNVSGSSVFLAGPTPRSKEVQTWRKAAISCFKSNGFTGTLLIPESRTWEHRATYDDQIEWETIGLTVASCIMFWVPRDLSLDSEGKLKMPAFTTNDEWGTWKASGKCVWGNPVWAEKVTYQRHYAEKNNIPLFDDITSTVVGAIDLASRLHRFKRSGV